MKKLLLILFIGMFLISFISAESIGTFTQGENIQLPQSCSSCTYNNISYISLPNSSTIMINDKMTKDGTFFYYDLNSSYIPLNGKYLVNGFGDLDGVDTVWAYSFEVTPNGKTFTTQNAISYLGFIIILLFTFFLTIYGSYQIRWKHEKSDSGKILTINNFRYLKVTLFALAYFELMFLFGLSFKFFNEANMEGFTEFFNLVYQIMLVLIYPLIIFLIIVIFVIWINNKKLHKRISLGLEK